MYKLTVFIPDSYLEHVKAALFYAGAGRVGNYDHCCWQIKGTGQFRPLANSNPFIGTHDKVDTIDEWRVEMIVADDYLLAVINALKETHPYESPAYDIIQTVDI